MFTPSEDLSLAFDTTLISKIPARVTHVKPLLRSLHTQIMLGQNGGVLVVLRNASEAGIEKKLFKISDSFPDF